MQFTLIHGSNIPSSYAVLFFIASEFTFTTRHIHNWASFLLWPSCFTLSGAISNCALLFPSIILDTFLPEGVIFQHHMFLPFHTIHGVLAAKCWSGLPFSPSVDHVLSELSTMTHPSWVALHGMTHSFIELHKPLLHDTAVIHEWAVLPFP